MDRVNILKCTLCGHKELVKVDMSDKECFKDFIVYQCPVCRHLEFFGKPLHNGVKIDPKTAI